MSYNSSYSQAANYDTEWTYNPSSSNRTQSQRERRPSRTTNSPSQRGLPCIPCSVCQLTFSRMEALNEHKRHFHGLSPLSPKCSNCSQQFQRTSQLKAHEASCAFKPVKCNTCRKMFSSYDEERSHYWSTHVHQDIRSKDSEGREMLPRKAAEYESYQTVKCKTCRMVFNSQEEERRHYWSTHVHQDVRSSDTRGKELPPMTDTEYESYLYNYGLN
ncbi:hypothetical protein VTL71DRAFT_2682 [Oculimacula yallundae]|uniref:C2H2-type domain-containing protein n=1 Tax=Oculimacula yallundae TaxID=86028 RepID=A0ABR4C9L4_9HELO